MSVIEQLPKRTFSLGGDSISDLRSYLKLLDDSTKGKSLPVIK